MLRTMDAQLITDNEDVPAKTFTLKRVVLIGLLMTLLTAAAVLFTLKDNLGATEEVSASAEGKRRTDRKIGEVRETNE